MVLAYQGHFRTLQLCVSPSRQDPIPHRGASVTLATPESGHATPLLKTLQLVQVECGLEGSQPHTDMPTCTQKYTYTYICPHTSKQHTHLFTCMQTHKHIDIHSVLYLVGLFLTGLFSVKKSLHNYSLNYSQVQMCLTHTGERDDEKQFSLTLNSLEIMPSLVIKNYLNIISHHNTQ